MAKKKVRCQWGHLFLGKNIIYRADGRRICKACRKDRDRAYYLRHRERILEQTHAYYRAHREAYLAYSRVRNTAARNAARAARARLWGDFGRKAGVSA
jgi:hypothetical protein